MSEGMRMRNQSDRKTLGREEGWKRAKMNITALRAPTKSMRGKAGDSDKLRATGGGVLRPKGP